MTRLFTDGAEMADILFWDPSAATVTAANTSPTPFASAYYYKGTDTLTAKTFSATSELYFRNRFYATAWGNASLTAPKFCSDANILLTVTPDAAGHIVLNGPSSILVDSGISMPINQWCLIEYYIKIADNPNGRFILRLDNTNIIDYTGDTLLTVYTTVNRIVYGYAASHSIHVDDLALNDTDNSDGKNDNSWCGDGIVVKITPSGSGTTNSWLNSGSVSGSANYLYVDEYPKDDDTTYVYASGSNTGLQDQYAMSAFAGTGKTILRIYAESRAKKTAADGSVIKIGYFPSGGTDQLSGSIALTTSYARIIGTSASANPVTGVAWTESDINALEYVGEVG